MHQIRNWLFIGTYREARSQEILRYYGISAMLLLAEPNEHRDIDSLYLAIEDGIPIPPQKLQQGVDYVRTQKELERIILIACGMGISRSTAFALAALKELEEKPLLDLFHDVRNRHSAAMPAPALWESLCTAYNEAVPWSALLRR